MSGTDEPRHPGAIIEDSDTDTEEVPATSAKVHICPLYLMRHVRDGGQNYQTPVDVWVIHTLINLG